MSCPCYECNCPTCQRMRERDHMKPDDPAFWVRMDPFGEEAMAIQVKALDRTGRRLVPAGIVVTDAGRGLGL